MNPFPEDLDRPELPDYVKEELANREDKLVSEKKKETKRLQKALRKLVSKKEAKAISMFLLKPQEDIDDIREKQTNYCISVFTSLADVSRSSSEVLTQMADHNKSMLAMTMRLDKLDNTES